MAVKWTEEQLSVIQARGSNLLVSAAAGSGKTAVLVERIIERVLSEDDPVDIDRILVVTFTKAAAAEMRDRITEAIEQRCNAEPQNERLARQQALVHNAQITTIDSFCAFVVKNHFGDIGLDPNYRIADEGELQLMQEDVLTEVFEEEYAKALAPDAGAEQAGFLELIRAYSGSKSDRMVKDMVSQICRMSASSPWPKEWVAGLTTTYQTGYVDAFLQTEVMQGICDYACRILQDAWTDLNEAYELAVATTGLENYAKTLQMDLAGLEPIIIYLHMEENSTKENQQDKEDFPKYFSSFDHSDGNEKNNSSSFSSPDDNIENKKNNFAQFNCNLNTESGKVIHIDIGENRQKNNNHVTEKKHESEHDLCLKKEKTTSDSKNAKQEEIKKLDYRKLHEFLLGFQFGRLLAVRGFKGDPQIKDAVKNRRDNWKDKIDKLKNSYFYETPEELYAQTQRIRPFAEQLVRLSLRYLDAMAARKREKRVLDFADVEHFALNILVDEQTKQARPAADEFRQQFVEIMIDEYQDSNQVQEEILRAISRESLGEHNRFMVGDVKQSIYRFRLAHPELFMEKYHTYLPQADAPDRRITLSRNFRSREQVLDFTNDIFYKIMQADLGDVAYDEDAALYLGADYPLAQGMDVEVLLYDAAKEPENIFEESVAEKDLKENLSSVSDHQEAGSSDMHNTGQRNDKMNQNNAIYANGASTDSKTIGSAEILENGFHVEEETMTRIEAHMVAQRILGLMAHGQVTDAKTRELRPVRYGDIVILMRGLKGRDTDFSEILSDAGIPVYLESSTGYFSATEVRTVLAFLQILDNPLQDIPLAAVLRSPLAGLSDEDLAQLEIQGRNLTVNHDFDHKNNHNQAFVGDGANDLISPPDDIIESNDQTKKNNDTQYNNKNININNESDKQKNIERESQYNKNKEIDVDSESDKNKDRKLSFSEAAWAQMQAATDGVLAQFYDFYQRMRARVCDTPIHELIQRILQESGYGDYVAALPAGAQRMANLDMLVAKAADYEQTSYKGLFHFVRYIEELHKYNVDFGEAEPGTQEEDAVSIMTIHKSKGLEFPIVILAGIHHPFNRMDSRQRLVLHERLGLGLDEMRLDPKRRNKSMLRKAISTQIGRESLGEELRILYVAMTRAKEKLILTGTVRNYEKQMSKYMTNARPGQPLLFTQRLDAGSPMDWILPAMQAYPDWYEVTVVGARDLVIYSAQEQAAQTLRQEDLYARIVGTDGAAVQALAEQLAFIYPYAHEAGRKSKYSVSELKRASMLASYDRAQNEAQVPAFIREEKEPFVPEFVKHRISDTKLTRAEKSAIPEKTDVYTDFGEKGKSRMVDSKGSYDTSSGAERGTAVHRVMECLDFAKILEYTTGEQLQCTNEAATALAKEEMSRMCTQGFIDEETAGLVPSGMVEGFLSDPVAVRMARADARGDLFREKPFVMEREGVLIQGIIDAFWLEEDRIVLLDYKTDAVRTAQELIDRYHVQLELYADALSRLFPAADGGVRQVEKLLYSFRLGQCICVR